MTDTSNTSGGEESRIPGDAEPTAAQPTTPLPSAAATPGSEWSHPSGTPAESVPAAAAPDTTDTDAYFTPAAAPADAETPLVVSDEGASFRRDRRSSLLVPIVVAAVVAALIGGGVGAGITLAVAPKNSTSTVDTSSSGSNSNVTINNPNSVTAITAVAAKVSPSVVTISVSTSAEGGTGSGIVLASDGYVLTNNHVVTLDGESSTGTISVTTSAGRVYPATVVGTDPTNDLAVIKLTGATGLQPATFADSSKLNVGDTAIAIGAPLGLSGTVTNGIVSALNRSISVASSAVPDSSQGDSSGESTNPFSFPGFGDGGSTGQTTTTNNISLAVVQTDAAINPGNSGGALLNSDGQVIGVNVAIASASDSSSSGTQSGSIGVGFAIPSNIAKRIGTDLMNHQKSTHGLLGANVQDTPTTATVAGADIAKVVSGGAAATAGLQAGDIVTRFNGIAIASPTDLTAQVRALAGGSSTTLTYVRDGVSKTVSVKLGTLDTTATK